MAEKKWSGKQLEILESGGENMEVLAAAGAGKTSVLVEKIFRLISEPGGTDVDRLLVMTFTRAAAAEMRERLATKIREALDKDPDNKRLLRQQMLLYGAQICTIDSFCQSVLREFYGSVDVDPAFRIGSEPELKLISADVIKELIEDCYNEGEKEFLDFIECYTGAKNDAGIEDLIKKLAVCAQAHPDPDAWLESEFEKSQPIDVETFLDSENVQFAVNYSKEILTGVKVRAERLAVDARRLGLEKYDTTFMSDACLVESMALAKDYESMRVALDGKFDKLPPKASVVNEFDKDLAGKLKAKRDAYKKDVEKIGSDFFFADPEELLRAHNTACAASRTLISLTREYLERLRAKKVENNTFGFDDIAHYALEILTEKDESGKLVASPRALVLRKRFDRIFIDEYQDSNDIQEEIANALAGPSSQVPYTFMVGDVKQSIYKFRMAKPELFMRRCELYRNNPSEGKVVVLDSNYRSFSCVLDSTNDVFYSAMRKEIGGITYDGEAALKPGTDAQKEAPRYKTVLAVIEGGVESEAAYAADIAKRLKEETGYYKGIAVLIRTKSNITKYKNVFEEAGIPVVTAEKTGFLTTFEIRTMLDFLKIIDNPARDVPFVGALASPIGGLENEELAKIRIEAGADILFCDAARKYAESGSDPVIREKLGKFFAICDEIRGMNLCRDLGECISRIYELTGFYTFCRTLPGAEVRTANLDLLISYANDFEKSSYSGLFSFVRYVDQLRSTEQDLDESAPADAENAVVLMTVHKSKGLEFPYVIVGGMNREMKELDAQESIIMNSDFGIWPVAIDPERKIKTKTLDKQVVRKRMTLDMKGEELRLLYVAMTRARERLFLVGSDKDGKDVSLWEDEAEGCRGGNPYPYSYIASAKSWLDVVGPVALANPEHFEVKSVTADEIRSLRDKEESASKVKYIGPSDVSLIHGKIYDVISTDEEYYRIIDETGKGRLFTRDVFEIADAQKKETKKSIKKEDFLEYYMNATCDGSDEEARDIIEQLSYSYPCSDLAKIPAKLSVSDIKKKHMDLNASPESTATEGEHGISKKNQKTEENKEETSQISDEKEYTESGSVVTKKNKAKIGKFTGADYGTLLHKVMRFLPFDLSADGIEAYLADLEKRGVLSTEEKGTIRRDDIEGFIASPVYARLNAASQSKTLRREQPFITGIPACEIDSELYGDSQTLIPVQGVIDCLFEEDGKVVVLDYKTDHRDESWLKENYKPQLDLYMRAATAALGKPQGHELLYSFYLKKCVEL